MAKKSFGRRVKVVAGIDEIKSAGEIVSEFKQAISPTAEK